MKIEKSKIPYLSIVFLILILIYPLRSAHIGVDLWDAGYSCANFNYSGLEYMDSMWYFATWIANVVGSFLSHLPGGQTMLGMNIYTGLLVGMIGVAAYIFCTRRLEVPGWLAFAGVILAESLCWAPSVALYNYLTYGFLLAGIICLYQGLVTDSRTYFIAAGAILGINIGNRFSNLVEAGLIVVVWYYGFICKKKFSKVLQETGFCMLGYAGAFGLFLCIMSVRYGLGNYVEGIMHLFEMTEHATDYSVGSMLIGMVWAYYDSTYWLKRFGVILACTFLVCLILPKKWVKVKQGITVAVTLLGMFWLYKSRYLYNDYATYDSVYYPCVMVFVMAICLAVYQMYSKGYTKEEKLQAVIVLLTITLTSIGSNNAMYSSMNNLFLVLPCFFGMVWRFLKREKHILQFPFQCIILMGICCLTIQTIRFGYVFKYEEATGGRNLYQKIEEIPVLKGMYTSEEKAVKLGELYSFLQESKLAERECILYGNIPGISYYMELPPAINIWSDLRSYSIERMQMDLAQLDLEATNNRPVIILEEKAVQYLKNNGNTEDYWEETAEEKLINLAELMELYDYQQGFYNNKYAVYY